MPDLARIIPTERLNQKVNSLGTGAQTRLMQESTALFPREAT
jgi:hypothetical protein